MTRHNMLTLAYLLYAAGSLCFFAGTLVCLGVHWSAK